MGRVGENWQDTKFIRKGGGLLTITTDTIALRLLYTMLKMRVRCSFEHSHSKRCKFLRLNSDSYMELPYATTYNITPPTQSSQKKTSGGEKNLLTEKISVVLYFAEFTTDTIANIKQLKIKISFQYATYLLTD